MGAAGAEAAAPGEEAAGAEAAAPDEEAAGAGAAAVAVLVFAVAGTVGNLVMLPSPSPPLLYASAFTSSEIAPNPPWLLTALLGGYAGVAGLSDMFGAHPFKMAVGTAPS